MSNEVLTRMIELLKNRGFVKLMTNDQSKQIYSYGPAGTLLKKNITQAWWQWMITSQENTFAVENSSSTDNTWDYFLDISRQLQWNLPFSITRYQSSPHTPPTHHKDKFLFNSCVKTNLQIQTFCRPSDEAQTLDSSINTRLQWWRQFSGNPAKFTATDITKTSEDRNFSTIQFEFPWGVDDVETLISYGDKPLQPIADTILKDHKFNHGKKNSLPSVIECNAILEQGLLAYLLDSYSGTSRKKGDKYVCLNLHPQLTPYKIAVCYQGTKCNVLRQLGGRISQELRKAGIVTLSQPSNLSLQSQFLQNDELGIPYTAVVQDEVLESGVVLIRNRNNSVMEQIHISMIPEFVQKNIAGSR